jgi:phospholipid transport system substrate-binding protein
MPNRAVLNRRTVLATMAGGVAVALAPPARALNADEARRLVDRLTDEVMSVINSGDSEAAMLKEFERIFARYADVPIIARTTLGVAWRSASASQRTAYVEAFRGYMARKYGKRFREFIGSEITVTGSRPEKSFYVVDSTVKLSGQAPFEVNWLVSDKSGKDLMFNLIIEGINMLRSEREEIGLMLDQNGGNIDKLITQLRTAG